jgi:dTDP-4-dehydrorhamnose 3,5-epimerase-like enzyme
MKLELVQNDNRGSIEIITGLLQFPEATIFKTKAGYARGGCVHNIHDEYICVLEGEVEYITEHLTTMSGNIVHKTILKTGGVGFIPKGTPHYFISLTDSTVIEWGADIVEKKEKHPVFRKIVDEINGKKLASEML